MNSRDLQKQVNEIKFTPKNEPVLKHICEKATFETINQRLQEETLNPSLDYKFIARLCLIAMVKLEK